MVVNPEEKGLLFVEKGSGVRKMWGRSVVKVEWIIKNVLLPPAYKKHVRELDFIPAKLGVMESYLIAEGKVLPGFRRVFSISSRVSFPISSSSCILL
jgi:hypothetical protein